MLPKDAVGVHREFRRGNSAISREGWESLKGLEGKPKILLGKEGFCKRFATGICEDEVNLYREPRTAGNLRKIT